MESLPGRVHDNIESLAAIREAAEREVRRPQRAIEHAAAVLGRPVTLYALLAGVVGWIAINAIVKLDPPPFFWLQGTIALYAAVVSTLVLVAQGRQGREAERRAHLEFHVNLLAEQKATKIIGLLEELRHDLPNVRDREDLIAQEMQEELDPRVVHSALSK